LKNWVKRAIRTFIQTALGYICVAIPAVDWNDSALKATLVGIGTSAIAAGVAAVMNYKDNDSI
jgi:hypothetical protein